MVRTGSGSADGAAACQTFTPRERRLVALMSTCTFLTVVNFTALVPFLPQIAGDLDSSVPLVGQAATVLTIFSAALGLVVGPLADLRGHRRLLLVGVVAVAANLAGSALAPSLPVLLLVALVGAAGDSLLFGLPLAVVSDHLSGGLRRRAVALVFGGLSIGVVTAPPLLAMLGRLVGWRGALLLAAAATLAVLVPTRAMLPPDPTPTSAISLRALGDTYRPLLGSRPTLGLLAASGARAAGLIGALAYFGAYVTEQLGGDAGTVAAAYLVFGLGVLAGNLFASRMPAHWSLRGLTAALAVGSSLVFGGAVILQPPAAVAAMLVALSGFASAIAGVGVATLVSQASPAGTGTTMVLNGSLINLGIGLGAAVGGFAIARAGYPALGLVVPLLTIPAAVLVLAAVPRNRPAPRVPEAAEPEPSVTG